MATASDNVAADLQRTRDAIRKHLTETRGAMAVCHACLTTAKKIDFAHSEDCWLGELGILPADVETL